MDVLFGVLGGSACVVLGGWLMYITWIETWYAKALDEGFNAGYESALADFHIDLETNDQLVRTLPRAVLDTPPVPDHNLPPDPGLVTPRDSS